MKIIASFLSKKISIGIAGALVSAIFAIGYTLLSNQQAARIAVYKAELQTQKRIASRYQDFSAEITTYSSLAKRSNDLSQQNDKALAVELSKLNRELESVNKSYSKQISDLSVEKENYEDQLNEYITQTSIGCVVGHAGLDWLRDIK